MWPTRVFHKLIKQPHYITQVKQFPNPPFQYTNARDTLLPGIRSKSDFPFQYAHSDSLNIDNLTVLTNGTCMSLPHS